MDGLPFDIEQLKTTLTTSGVSFGLNLLAAIATFIIGRLIVGVIMRGVRSVMARVDFDPLLERFISNIIRTLLNLFVILAALQKLGFEMTSVIAVLGAAGLAVGLALQGSLSNFASGVLIILFRPYREGDYVEAAGVGGSVQEVSIFNTILLTPDNRRVIVPNSNITSDAIVNYSSQPTRRIDLVIGVGYEDDLKKAEQALRDVVAADKRILEEPAPTIAVSELGDSSVNFVVRPWVKTSDYWAVRFELIKNIKNRLDADGISIPYPQRDVHVFQQAS
ncbi:MAG: mechanosensitive ion channel domain-containing protein [Pseudomonadota bacterium]